MNCSKLRLLYKNHWQFEIPNVNKLSDKSIFNYFSFFFCSPFPFSNDQVRVLLYRECDWRGKRLLFDSSAIECINNSTTTTSSTSSSCSFSAASTASSPSSSSSPSCSTSTASSSSARSHQNGNNSSSSSSGYSSSSSHRSSTNSSYHIEYCDGFTYKYGKPNADYNNLGEMVFGSVAMSFRGTTLKVSVLDSQPKRISLN